MAEQVEHVQVERFGMSCVELARAMDVNVASIYRWMRMGLIQVIWIGAKKVVPADEVNRLRREGVPTPRGRNRAPESYKRKSLRESVSK